MTSLSNDEVRSLAEGSRSKGTLLALYAPWCRFCQALEPSYEALAAHLADSNVTVAKYQADIDRDFCNDNLQLKTFPTIVYLPPDSKQVRTAWWGAEQ